MALCATEGEVTKLCRQLGLTANLDGVERAWQAEMGGWDGMARIVALDNFALVVEVRSAPAMHELTMRRRELVRKLNRYFKDPFVRDVQVRMSNAW